jgi:hypothetical protein
MRGTLRRLASRIKAEMDLRRYLAGGRKPWTPGYGLHKQRSIEAALVAASAPSAAHEWIHAYRPKGWVKSDREGAEGALYFDIHQRKDYDPDYAAASRAVACLELRA